MFDFYYDELKSKTLSNAEEFNSDPYNWLILKTMKEFLKAGESSNRIECLKLLKDLAQTVEK